MRFAHLRTHYGAAAPEVGGVHLIKLPNGGSTGMSDLFWLTEQQFARLEPFLPTDTSGVPRVDDRRVISGIVHVLKCVCRWKDAPSEY